MAFKSSEPASVVTSPIRPHFLIFSNTNRWPRFEYRNMWGNSHPNYINNFIFLRQDLTLQLSVVWNSLCSLGQPSNLLQSCLILGSAAITGMHYAIQLVITSCFDEYQFSYQISVSSSLKSKLAILIRLASHQVY